MTDLLKRVFHTVTGGRYRAEEEPEETTLKQVKWTEEYEHTDELITERLVWSGGAETEVTYSREQSRPYPHAYIGPEGEYLIDIDERPAFTKELDRVEMTETRTKTKRTWVEDVPPGVVETGKTKTLVAPTDD